MKVLSAFALVLPLLPIVSVTGAEYPECESNGGVVERIGDGRCDYEGDVINNIEECGYDGGDCCVCDCEDGEYACGADRYSCLDPVSTCHYPDCTANGGDLSWLPDGWCDQENNIEECGYDGGDCCGCGCTDGLARACGIAGYDCEDPASACTGQFVSYLGCFSDPQGNRVFEFKSSDSAMTAEVCSELCSDSLFYGTQYSTECWCGDNADYNANGVGVCDMSCSGDSDEICGGWDAISVYVSGVTPNDPTFPECESNGGVVERIGDGRCDYEGDHINNIEECGYDGGDCCVCDCEDGEYACGADRYSCLDPVSTCHYPDCTANGGDLSWLPDGWCDQENNIEECGYDGGDCCGCECTDGLARACGIAGYDCEDSASACTGQFVSYLGCFSDPQDNRVFEFKSSDSAMTAEVCSELCADSLFYGTQFSKECWCGDNADYNANGAGECDMSCSGDSDEICGGWYALSVYVSGVTPNDPIFRGCYSDPEDNRIFELVASSQDMTAETCMGHCGASQYYGTQYSTECWCGDVNAQYSVNGEGVCDMPCSGNSEETCGGYFSMSVYEAI